MERKIHNNLLYLGGWRKGYCRSGFGFLLFCIPLALSMSIFSFNFPFARGDSLPRRSEKVLFTSKLEERAPINTLDFNQPGTLAFINGLDEGDFDHLKDDKADTNHFAVQSVNTQWNLGINNQRNKYQHTESNKELNSFISDEYIESLSLNLPEEFFKYCVRTYLKASLLSEEIVAIICSSHWREDVDLTNRGVYGYIFNISNSSSVPKTFRISSEINDEQILDVDYYEPHIHSLSSDHFIVFWKTRFEYYQSFPWGSWAENVSFQVVSYHGELLDQEKDMFSNVYDVSYYKFIPPESEPSFFFYCKIKMNRSDTYSWMAAQYDTDGKVLQDFEEMSDIMSTLESQYCYGGDCEKHVLLGNGMVAMVWKEEIGNIMRIFSKVFHINGTELGNKQLIGDGYLSWFHYFSLPNSDLGVIDTLIYGDYLYLQSINYGNSSQHILVNNFTFTYEDVVSYGRVFSTSFNNGTKLVVWDVKSSSKWSDGSKFKVFFGQIFHSRNLSKHGAQFLIQYFPFYGDIYPRIERLDSLPNGGFIVIWREYETNVNLRVYDYDFNPLYNPSIYAFLTPWSLPKWTYLELVILSLISLIGAKLIQKCLPRLFISTEETKSNKQHVLSSSSQFYTPPEVVVNSNSDAKESVNLQESGIELSERSIPKDESNSSDNYFILGETDEKKENVYCAYEAYFSMVNEEDKMKVADPAVVFSQQTIDVVGDNYVIHSKDTQYDLLDETFDGDTELKMSSEEVSKNSLKNNNEDEYEYNNDNEYDEIVLSDRDKELSFKEDNKNNNIRSIEKIKSEKHKNGIYSESFTISDIALNPSAPKSLDECVLKESVIKEFASIKVLKKLKKVFPSPYLVPTSVWFSKEGRNIEMGGNESKTEEKHNVLSNTLNLNEYRVSSTYERIHRVINDDLHDLIVVLLQLQHLHKNKLSYNDLVDANIINGYLVDNGLIREFGPWTLPKFRYKLFPPALIGKPFTVEGDMNGIVTLKCYKSLQNKLNLPEKPSSVDEIISRLCSDRNQQYLESLRNSKFIKESGLLNSTTFVGLSLKILFWILIHGMKSLYSSFIPYLIAILIIIFFASEMFLILRSGNFFEFIRKIYSIYFKDNERLKLFFVTVERLVDFLEKHSEFGNKYCHRIIKFVIKYCTLPPQTKFSYLIMSLVVILFIVKGVILIFFLKVLKSFSELDEDYRNIYRNEEDVPSYVNDFDNLLIWFFLCEVVGLLILFIHPEFYTLLNTKKRSNIVEKILSENLLHYYYCDENETIKYNNDLNGQQEINDVENYNNSEMKYYDNIDEKNSMGMYNKKEAKIKLQGEKRLKELSNAVLEGSVLLKDIELDRNDADYVGKGTQSTVEDFSKMRIIIHQKMFPSYKSLLSLKKIYPSPYLFPRKVTLISSIDEKPSLKCWYLIFSEDMDVSALNRLIVLVFELGVLHSNGFTYNSSLMNKDLMNGHLTNMERLESVQLENQDSKDEDNNISIKNDMELLKESDLYQEMRQFSNHIPEAPQNIGEVAEALCKMIQSLVGFRSILRFYFSRRTENDSDINALKRSSSYFIALNVFFVDLFFVLLPLVFLLTEFYPYNVNDFQYIVALIVFVYFFPMGRFYFLIYIKRNFEFKEKESLKLFNSAVSNPNETFIVTSKRLLNLKIYTPYQRASSLLFILEALLNQGAWQAFFALGYPHFYFLLIILFYSVFVMVFRLFFIKFWLKFDI